VELRPLCDPLRSAEAQGVALGRPALSRFLAALVAVAFLASAFPGPLGPGEAHARVSKKKSTSRKRAAARPRKPAGPPPAPVAQTLRSYTGPNSTRLVLDLSRSSGFRIQADSSSKSFAMIVPKGVKSPSFGTPVLNDGAVSAIDADETGEGFRLTVHVAEWSAPRVFGLEGDEGQAARVVVDVVRPGQAERDALERARVDRLTSTAKRIVVVDPGHGGEAVGAVGPRRTYEKDVTLAIARRLKEQLEKQPGVQVVLTRTGDYDVPLRERYRIAERYAADAFVSIHCNSSRTRSGSGTEVYFLSLSSASDEASKALADVENAADKISAGPEQGGDDDLVGILFDLRQTESMQQSSVLAEAILGEIEGGRRLEARGVRQAAFAVLKSPIVPSVLVETAFINNPSEERLLRDPGFQQEMGEQISRGVVSYLARAPVLPRDGRTGRPAPSTPANLGLAR
jgi:N-acetylmuramoyl-L-alanine amidase